MQPLLEFGSTPAPESPLSASEQRRVRRMISNRESARRSRMRKQRHLEDLRRQIIKLKALNSELLNRVGLMTTRCLMIRSDNERLRFEYDVFRRRFLEIQRVWVDNQLQRLALPAACGGFGFENELQHNSNSLLA